MNRNTLTLLLALAAGSASAQRTNFGIIAGPQAGTAQYELRQHRQATTWNPGGHLGVIARIPFEGRLYFTPSLVYTYKSFNVTLADTSSNPGIDAVANELRLHAFQLAPLFTIYMGKGTKGAYVQFGPSADIGLAGNERVTLNNGSTVSRGLKFSPDAYGRVTASLLFRLGVETRKGLFLSAFYEHGLGSLNQNDFGPSIKHRVAGINVGKYLTRR